MNFIHIGTYHKSFFLTIPLPNRKMAKVLVRRIGFLAQLLTRNDVIVLVAAISPYRNARDSIRHNIKNFIEVYVNAPLRVCEDRDVKGLYKKAREGKIKHFTGIDDPYELPLNPEVECRTDKETLEDSMAKILCEIKKYVG